MEACHVFRKIFILYKDYSILMKIGVYFILFILLDLLVFKYEYGILQSPFGEDIQGETWHPWELLEEGQSFRFAVNSYSRSFPGATLTYDILNEIENGFRLRGKVEGEGWSDTSGGRSASIKTEDLSMVIVRPGQQVSIGEGEGDFTINRYELRAEDSGSPAMAWNAYVYHPIFMRFARNTLGEGEWVFTDVRGYVSSVKVYRYGDGYVCEIIPKGRELDKLWISPDQPLPYKREKYSSKGALEYVVIRLEKTHKEVDKWAT
jgi:hypothetical protein